MLRGLLGLANAKQSAKERARRGRYRALKMAAEAALASKGAIGERAQAVNTQQVRFDDGVARAEHAGLAGVASAIQQMLFNDAGGAATVQSMRVEPAPGGGGTAWRVVVTATCMHGRISTTLDRVAALLVDPGWRVAPTSQIIVGFSGGGAYITVDATVEKQQQQQEQERG